MCTATVTNNHIHVIFGFLTVFIFIFAEHFLDFILQNMPYIPTITNYTQLWWVPNVVVAHEKEGIEAVHLASGRTLCKVKMRERNLILRFL